jgi:hypothetical protein
VPASPDASFQKGLLKVETELHPMVDKILWAAAARDGELAIDYEIITAHIFNDIQDDPTSLKGYQRYARQHNRLVNMQDELLNHPSLLAVNSYPPPTDSVARLTSNAYNVLSSEIDRIEALLYQARASRLLVACD